MTKKADVVKGPLGHDTIKRYWAITGLTLKEKPVRREHGSYGARGARHSGPDTAASSSLAEERGGIPF